MGISNMSETVKQATGAEAVAWDLSDLYAAADDPAIDRDLDAADARARTLAEKYKGRIADLDPEDLRDFIEEYQGISELIAKTIVFSYLDWSVNVSDPARGALLQQELVFWELEWANAPDDKAKTLMEHSAVRQYRHWLEVARLNKPHLLTEPEEKILSEKQVTGRGAWVRYFNEVLGNQRYELDGERVPAEAILTVASFEPDRERRKTATASVTKGLKEIAHTATFAFNTLLADKASDDRLRKYSTWISARNLGNQVSDEAVEALIKAVTGRYDIVARYYQLKRKLLGYDELFEYDRYAPLPAADTFYAWDQAREIVLNAFEAFHPRIAESARLFFDKQWIDAPTRDTKIGGAYCYSIGGQYHPYVMLNYEAKPRDVMTLAHELGHGVHGVLAQPLGVLQSHAPITTAETASVFGEMLVFNDLMARESDPKMQLAMLTSKIEDQIATVFRQIAMNRFEDAIHNARREGGELSTDQFSEHWLKVQRAMFEDSLTITDDYSIWWAYVTHFVDYPGYVYGDAFGNLLVLALYARYQEVGKDFADGYVEMLAAGGSEWPHKIVEPLGIDLNDPDFWEKGLDILDNMVGEAEKLAQKAS